MSKLAVTYWLYSDPYGRRRYTAEHINAQLPMLKKHLHIPYRVVCITDQTGGLDPSIEVYPAPLKDDGPEPQQHDPTYPPCLRRLWNYSDDAREIGERIWAMDADSLLVRDVTPMVDRGEDLVVWRSPSKIIQGCSYLLRTGSHRRVWDAFQAHWKPWVGQGKNAYTDHGWLNKILPANTPCWTEHDGVYLPRAGRRELPPEARLVSFSDEKPWTRQARVEFPWISEHYELPNDQF